MKRDDVVFISMFAGTEDERARVTEVFGDYVVVSNMNMPFSGTFAREIFLKDEVEVIHESYPF